MGVMNDAQEVQQSDMWGVCGLKLKKTAHIAWAVRVLAWVFILFPGLSTFYAQFNNIFGGQGNGVVVFNLPY